MVNEFKIYTTNHDKMEVKIHLGAHKTATTYVQTVLSASAEILMQSETFYLPLDVMRPKYTRLLRKPEIPISESQVEFEKLLNPKVSTLLLSEENLLGYTKEIVKGRLYKTTTRTVKRIREIFNDCKVTFFLTIRDYATFFPSMYCEYVLHNQFISFEEFCSNQNLLEFKWNNLINKIQDQFGADMHLNIFIYEELKEDFDMFFKPFTNLYLSELVKNDNKIVRPSFNSESIEFLEILSKKFNTQQAVNIATAMHNALLKEGVGSKFLPFNNEDENKLHTRYIADISRLRKENSQTLFC